MLFKTQSASVYGIDAYLVEVEVDVGSARMQDFNVVCLPTTPLKRAANASSPRSATVGSSFLMGRASPSIWPQRMFAKKARLSISRWLSDSSDAWAIFSANSSISACFSESCRSMAAFALSVAHSRRHLPLGNLA